MAGKGKLQWQTEHLFYSAEDANRHTMVFDVAFFLWGEELQNREGTFFANIFFLISFLVGAVSTSTMIALSVNAVIASDIAAYTLVATSILSIIGGAAMIGIKDKIELTRNLIENTAKNTGLVVMSTLVGYLSYHSFITNSILMPILGQAGIAAGFSLIIPIIGTALYAFSQWAALNTTRRLATEFLPLMIGIALGTFSAIAMNIETGSMMLDMATEALTGCAIAIVTTVVLSWFLNGFIIVQKS